LLLRDKDSLLWWIEVPFDGNSNVINPPCQPIMNRREEISQTSEQADHKTSCKEDRKIPFVHAKDYNLRQMPVEKRKTLL
jgi:hypothetical protein